MLNTNKFVSYSGKKLEELLSDLVTLEEYKEEKEAELEVSIDGFSERILNMVWYVSIGSIPTIFIRPFLDKEIDYAYFMKYDDSSSRMIVKLRY